MVVSALAAALALCAVYVATASHARSVRERAPHHPVVPPGNLDLYDLALLTAGTARGGEVALTELYLGGRLQFRGSSSRLGWAKGRSTLGVRRNRALDLAVQKSRQGRSAVAAAAVVHEVRQHWHPHAELARLRGSGLMLPEGALRTSRGWRRTATILQTVAAVLLGAGTVLASLVILDIPALYDGTDFGAVYIGFMASLLVLGLVVIRWGFAFGVAAMVPISGGYLALPGQQPAILPHLVLACVLWLVTYGVYMGTGGSLGTRTAAGDALLAAERAELADDTSSGHDRALRAVALYGLAGVRQRVKRQAFRSPDDALTQVADLARRVGAVHRHGAGTNSDGGKGGAVADNGDAGGFPGGDGAGGSVGDGAGGGDGGSGDGGGGGGDGGGGGG